MKQDDLTSKFWLQIPPWVIGGILAVLIPTFAVMTANNIRRQKAHGQQLLVEKGAALIRSFEAGTRTGMMGPMGGNFKLQRLLIETARQPDIAFLMVVTKSGRIRAHSDPLQVGRQLQSNLELSQIVGSDQLHWRIQTTADSERLFVIYKKFNPLPRPPGARHHRSRRRGHPLPPPESEPVDQVIFVGLDMHSADAARLADTRQTLIMGAVLLLVGLAGVLLLFYIQGYRTTRRSLSQIKAFSDTLVANLPLGLIAIASDLRVVACNPAATAILNRPEGDLIGQPAHNALPTAVTATLPNPDRPSPEVREHEVECTLDGKTAILEITVSSYDNLAVQGHQWVLLIKEVTEIRNLRKAVTRHQRLVTVGRLAAGVAHEIRNPLSSIKGFATYFKQRYVDHPKDQQTATTMIQEIDRLNRVVSQLLEFAKPVAVIKRPVEMASLIQETLALLRPRFDKSSIRVDTRFHKETPAVGADPDQLKQVLINLLFNSLEALPEGGRITLELGPDPNSTGCRLQVQDNGTGIPADKLAHVFDPYFTTKPAGTGLGLAICHNIIEAHEGTIQIFSHHTQGTTVDVRLPAPKSHSLAEAPHART